MKNTKKRITPVDFLLIFAAFVIISYFASFYFSQSTLYDVAEQEIIEVEAVILLPYSENYRIDVGQKVKTNDYDKTFGSVKSITYAASSEESINDTTEAIIVIESNASTDGNVYNSSGIEFKEGDALQLCTSEVCFSAQITGIRRRIAFANEIGEN